MIKLIYPNGVERELTCRAGFFALGSLRNSFDENQMHLPIEHRDVIMYEVVETSVDGAIIWVEKHK